MLENTRAIVLRSVKYGDSGLISTLFTEKQGVQAYIVQGARSSRAKSNKAAMLQPATLLDVVVYHKPNSGLQHIREMQYGYLYIQLQEDIVRNSIALFSAELLLRLLPEHAQQEQLFGFAFKYFQWLDQLDIETVANFPLYFIIQCSHLLGYEISGSYSANTPYLDLQDGAFTAVPPSAPPYLDIEEAKALNALLNIEEVTQLKNIVLNAAMRNRLLDWYIEFLHRHTQHLSSIKSLAVLRAILH